MRRNPAVSIPKAKACATAPLFFAAAPLRGRHRARRAFIFNLFKFPTKKCHDCLAEYGCTQGERNGPPPITSEKLSPQCPCRQIFPAGAAAAAAHSRPIKKLSPVSMRGNSQNGGQTTKSLLIKPQCSGVPIQQAVSLSSSFPRHCLLFVAFFAGRLHLPLQKSCRTAFVQQLFVIRSVFSHGDLPDGSRFRTLPHRAQAPARCRPGYRWGSAHRGTAG